MKTINTKTTKRVAAIVLAAVAAFSVMGCSVEKNFTTTEVHTVTDADGNTTTTTTTTANGETTTETTKSTPEEEATEAEPTVATISFDNETDFDFAELYFASSASDSWGDNILGDDASLAVGDVITFNDAFTYSANNTAWDIKAVDSEGNNIEFAGADMLAADDAENIHILFGCDTANQSYSLSVQ